MEERIRPHGPLTPEPQTPNLKLTMLSTFGITQPQLLALTRQLLQAHKFDRTVRRQLGADAIDHILNHKVVLSTYEPSCQLSNPLPGCANREHHLRLYRISH